MMNPAILPESPLKTALMTDSMLLAARSFRMFPMEELTTRSKGNAGHPVISPRGRTIAFANLERHSTLEFPRIRDSLIYDRKTWAMIMITAGGGSLEW